MWILASPHANFICQFSFEEDLDRDSYFVGFAMNSRSTRRKNDNKVAIGVLITSKWHTHT